VLGLFHNELFNESRVIEILSGLPRIKELSIDGNPVILPV